MNTKRGDNIKYKLISCIYEKGKYKTIFESKNFDYIFENFYEETIIDMSLILFKFYEKDYIENAISYNKLMSHYQKCISFLVKYNYSEKMLINKMSSSLNEEDIFTLIEKCKQVNILNDNENAKKIYNYLKNIKLKGPFYIKSYIENKGFEYDFDIFELYDLEKEVMNIKKIINNRLKLNVDTTVENKKMKLFRYLFNNGYTTEYIYEAIEALNLNIDEDENKKLLVQKYRENGFDEEEILIKIDKKFSKKVDF